MSWSCSSTCNAARCTTTSVFPCTTMGREGNSNGETSKEEKDPMTDISLTLRYVIMCSEVSEPPCEACGEEGFAARTDARLGRSIARLSNIALKRDTVLVVGKSGGGARVRPDGTLPWRSKCGKGKPGGEAKARPDGILPVRSWQTYCGKGKPGGEAKARPDGILPVQS